MKKNILTLFVSFCFFSGTSKATILPPNELYLEDNLNSFDGITEKEFGDSIDYVLSFYQPLALLHDGSLESVKLWKDSNVNASAEQKANADRKSKKWVVNMYGGLARRPEITLDGFALVICHELGHHFAGYPFSSSWAADEGQSDYFAGQSCARTIWKNQKETNSGFRTTVGNLEKEACDKAWKLEDDQNLCYRLAAGTQSISNLLAALNKNPSPKFDTPDTAVVRNTSHTHPAAQCRLDTYFRASLCTTTFDEKLIPGLTGEGKGNTAASETIAIKNSCGVPDKNTQLDRPACWFKSLLP